MHYTAQTTITREKTISDDNIANVRYLTTYNDAGV